MGCTSQKMHAQQIAYQRDFLGACWNSPIGEEEAEEYLASRWMGVSKEVMALYTNNHCFTVRTLNKDEKVRAEAAAAGKPAVRAPDDPAGLAPGFGGDLGAGGGGLQTPSASQSIGESNVAFPGGRSPTHLCATNSPFSPTPELGPSRGTSGLTPPTKAVVTPPPMTTMRQGTSSSHAHAVVNNSVTSAGDEHETATALGTAGGSAVTNGSMLSAAGRMATAERIKKSADPAALRNVVKDSIESERVLHSEHPYLQRHGLSVYGGVVFRCAPAHRLYHRISLVPEASMKRLYDMQVTTMSRSVMGDAASSMIGPPGGGFGGQGFAASMRPYHPGGSSSNDNNNSNQQQRFLFSLDGEDRGVPPATPRLPRSTGPSMMPSPMSRPITGPPPPMLDNSVIYTNLPLLGSSLDQAPLPTLPLGAVPARHLRFASGPEVQQSAVIDAWTAESPLSAFNNYPAEDRDVAGVTASRPPVIIGSVTAMELLALPPNAEVCFGGWLYVSLQDEQERLRKSLKRYAARQRRRAAKAAAEDVARFTSLSSSFIRSKPSSQQRRNEQKSTSGFDDTDVEMEGSLANRNTRESASVSLTKSSPPAPPMPTFRDDDDASPSSDSAVPKDADGGEARVPAAGARDEASCTIAFKNSAPSPLSRAVGSDGEAKGERDESRSSCDGEEKSLNTTAVFAKTSSADASPEISQAAVSATTAATTAAAKVAAAPAAAATTPSSQPATPTPTPQRSRSQLDPASLSAESRAARSVSMAPLRPPPTRTPSTLRPRASSVPPSPMLGPAVNPALPTPVRHTGRYAREAMEADTLNAAWLPYAYIVVAVPMYECSLVPTTFHTAFTRHKAVSLNLGNAQSRQAYGVGCITGVRYGGVMVIEYRDKIEDAEDAEWIAELMRVNRRTQGDAATGSSNANDNNDDDSNEFGNRANFDMSTTGVFRHIHHSATHRARAEKLRRIKSRIWNKLRRQGLHVVLAATRMADRRHRQQRASVAMEVNNMFASSQMDTAPTASAAAATSTSHTTHHFAPRRTTANTPGTAASPSAAAQARRNTLGASVRGNGAGAILSENLGVDEGGIGADYAEGGAEELNEAMEDIVEDFDSATSTGSSRSDDDDDGGDTFSRASRSSSSTTEGRGDVVTGGSVDGSVRGDRASRKRGKGQWWRSASSRRRHHRRGDSVVGGGGENEMAASRGGGRHHHHHHHHRRGVTTREDRLRWTDPRMADDFYVRGTFRQIGGMKYLDVVSLMDGCPVSELVQGIKRWVINLLSMPVKARPICLFLQRYEGIAASLRIMQTQLTATALASNVASGKQLAQGNFSFHMPNSGAGALGMEVGLGNDEFTASFVSQQPADPLLDPTSSSALINASFAAMQAPAAIPTRVLAYHTYYCGPLEPEIRAVLAPEVEAMIASCQTRQLPDVLRSPESRAENTQSEHRLSGPLSPPPHELERSNHSTLTHATAATSATAAATIAGNNGAPKSSPPPPAAAARAPGSPDGPASPHFSPSPPGLVMPHAVDVSGKLSEQDTHQKPQSTTAHVDPAAVSQAPLRKTASAAAAIGGPSASNPASPHGSFAAASASAAAKTTGAIDMAAAHAKPPANTVPKTITEFLFYDDPTKKDTGIGNSFTAGNGQALAAAAAALILKENVKGPAAVGNGSFVGGPPPTTNSFPAAARSSPPAEDDAPPSVHGGSFGHTRQGPLPRTLPVPVTATLANISLITVSDGTNAANNTSSLVKAQSPSPTADATKAKQVDTKDSCSDASSDTTSKCEKRESNGRGTPSPKLLLPAARARSGSHTEDPKDGKRKGGGGKDVDSDSEDDDSFSDDEAEERELEWQLADRELRALKSELDEMTYLISTARAELLERLEELIQLGAIFLPHTRPDQVGLCLITMKMLRQYPEEVPVKEIHTDWVPLLMALLTSSREQLFCTGSYEGGYDVGRAVDSAHGFLATYNNIVAAADMCDANKRRQACDAGITKYMIEPLPPMPAPRRLHDVVIAPQPVRFTKAMLQEMKRVGMDSEGLSFSFSGGSLGVLAGVLYYYSDFLRAKYRSEVAAVGGRAKDAGATVLDVLSRGGYNVLLRRIWIWGVTPESSSSKKSSAKSAAAATKKLLHKKLKRGDDGDSVDSSPTGSATPDDHDHVTTNTASIGNGFVRVVGKPFRGSEAYALYDAITHYLRTLEELCTEHQGNNSMAPQAPVKRRSVLNAFRRNRDTEPTSTGNDPHNTNAANTADGLADDASGARELVPQFEVCVASNYYYKRMLDEAHWPARSNTSAASAGGGVGGLPHRPSLTRMRSSDAVRMSPSQPSNAAADARGKLGTSSCEGGDRKPSTTSSGGAARWMHSLLPAEKQAQGSLTFPNQPPPSRKHGGGHGGSSGHYEGSVLERPYCGGEETVKKDALQRKATKKFYGFLSDHYEQWRARHSEDKATSSYGKRITVSLN